MTPTIAQYADFAQTFASRNARLRPLHLVGHDGDGYCKAVFRFGTDRLFRDVLYWFTTELDMACCRLMWTAVAEVEGDTMILNQEDSTRRLAEFYSVNPYDGSEAQQEARLMDRRCLADIFNKGGVSVNDGHWDGNDPATYDWRTELHLHHNSYEQNR